MADAWQSAWVEILPDFKNFKSTANKEMSSTLGAAGTAGGVVAGKNMGQGLLGGIKGIGGPLIAAVAALGIGKLIGEAIGTSIRYGLGAIDLASDLNESFNAVEVTFGEDIAKELKVIAEAAPETLRVTRTTFNEYATRFSAFAKTIVGEGGDVVGFLDELTTRGADFASVYNVDVGEALELFQSGLAGETEPLRKYGIDLSAASVSAYAYANGIGEAGKELTEAEKIQARYASLLDQTSKVQGDAANTGGDLAAQQRDLAVSMEEVQTKLGQALLPGFLDLVTYVNDEVVPVFGDLIEKVGPIFGEALEESGPKIEELVDKLIPLAESFAEMAAEEGIPAFLDTLDSIAENAPEWIDAFVAVDDAVREADQGFRDATRAANDFIMGDGRTARIEWLDGLTSQIGQWATDNVNAFTGAWDKIFAFIGSIPGRVSAYQDGVRNAGRELIKKFAEGITAGITFVSPAIGGVMDFVKGFFPQSPAERGPFSGAGWDGLKLSGEAITEQFSAGLNAGKNKVDIGSMVSVPSISGTAGISVATNSSTQAQAVGGFNNYGTIQVTDERALVAEVQKRQRRAAAAAGLRGVVVA